MLLPRYMRNPLYAALTPSCAVPMDWVKKVTTVSLFKERGSEDYLVANVLGFPARLFSAPRAPSDREDIISPRTAVDAGSDMALADRGRISFVVRTIKGQKHTALMISDRLGLKPESETAWFKRRRNVRVALLGVQEEHYFRATYLQVGGKVLPLTEGNLSDALLYAQNLTAQIKDGTYDPAAARGSILTLPEGMLRAWGQKARDGIIGLGGRISDIGTPKVG